MEVDMHMDAPAGGWDENMTSEEVIRQILESWKNANVTFVYKEEIFFVFGCESPGEAEIIGVTIPPEWRGKISMEELQHHVLYFMEQEEDDIDPIVMIVNGLSAVYHRCYHSHVLFLPVDTPKSDEAIHLWCNKHEKYVAYDEKQAEINMSGEVSGGGGGGGGGGEM